MISTAPSWDGGHACQQFVFRNGLVFQSILTGNKTDTIPNQFLQLVSVLGTALDNETNEQGN